MRAQVFTSTQCCIFGLSGLGKEAPSSSIRGDGIMSTLAVSEVIRKRKFNYNSGQPAPESITDQIYGNTLSISEIKMADIPDVDLSSLGVKNYGSFSVEVVDPVLTISN